MTILVVFIVLLTYWSWLQFWNNWNCMQVEWFGSGEIIQQLEEILLRRPHDHLKVVNMTGVYGYKSLLDLALYIARNATALQRMVIDPTAKRSFLLTRNEQAQFAIRWGRMMAERHLKGQGLDGILTIL